jgi:uncharacterized protein
MKKYILLLVLICTSIHFPSVVHATQPRPDGSLAHFSLPVRSAQVAIDFYERLFGWKFQKLFEGAYLIKMPGSVGGGISEDPNATPGKGVVLYIHFKELDTVLEKAKSLGAADIQGPFAFPGGRYATFLDLDGNRIGLSSFNASGEGN